MKTASRPTVEDEVSVARSPAGPSPTRTGRRRPQRRPRSPQRTPRRSGQQPSHSRSSAAQKAYARRAQRTAAVDHVEHGRSATATGVGSLLRVRLPRSRASFVLLVMALLATGVVLTMWLSTQAIADSYRLERMRTETARLAERADQLQRQVAQEESVTTLATRAEQLGMVQSGNPARIVVSENGKRTLVGKPRPAGG
ncbi:MAG: hypothetical protein GEV00_11450 [Actinophytocola sp.]|nr:hypothetical protein [Actinophytocola sp.]